MKAASAIWRFGFRQTRRGALIMGILAGFMIIVQGLGYVASYPDPASRAHFASSLGAAPGLGVLYGESKNTASPEGYILYRTGPFLSTIASIWALLTITRLLRGQEEDGRWELIASSRTTNRQASRNIVAGFGLALMMAVAISTLFTLASNFSPDIELNLPTSLAINAAIFLPAALFGSIGIVVSQLSQSRRRAIMYGLVPLIVFFAMRSLSNSISDWYWLKKLTPFGWADLASPVIDPQPWWLLLFVAFVPVFAALGLYYAGKRDYGMGVFNEPSYTRSKYWLLGTPLDFALRQNVWGFLGWATLALWVSGLIAAISKVAVDAVKDAPNIKGAIGHLAGSSTNDFAVAFLGAGVMFTVMILLVMVAFAVASIRQDEAKTYLDTLLTQPVRRSSWLAGRLVLVCAVVTLILAASGELSWWLAHNQGINLDLGNFLLVCSASTSTIIFTLGIGTLVYGVVPRLAVAAIYLVITWSFMVDIVRSVVKLNDWVINLSLFHYISLSPTAAPDWKTFGWLVGLGVAMMAVGIVAFSRRDIASE